MFKFGFSGEDSPNDEKNSDAEIHWFPAREIQISDEQLSREYDTTSAGFSGINLKLVRSDNVALNVRNEEHENIIRAESQHSDLIPAIYEGGLKIWECTHDLSEYLIGQEINLRDKRVLDLGCGAGILGIISLLKGATVHFQDYNSEVIQLLTIPNVTLNSTDDNAVKENCRFYSGDWAAFSELFSNKYLLEEQKYDFILSSETIYNAENHEKLYQVFKKCLKKDGIGYIAGKTYYFGVGGGMRQFENLVLKDKALSVEKVWKSEEGLQREVLKLTKLL
ncbi:histidine protein methyltransferase 1 homolog [Fopius arisanus]|uniref:protein-histidine N-methyltransferase n=1 Tax=Fopius arisanus TaxID=64838 RepID=A0A9R1T0N7_9HYME|nr:PREDICTED: histidine protein methyltransferase 1 homolog [Fopius arisanus]